MIQQRSVTEIAVEKLPGLLFLKKEKNLALRHLRVFGVKLWQDFKEQETSGGLKLSRFYEKNKFAKIEGGPMCRCLIWGPNLNLLYGMSGTSFRAEGFVPEW